MRELESSIDRVIAGPERETRVMSDADKKIIAYHEGGHALVGHLLPQADPVHKVSIVARGRALGWTLSLPSEDRYMKSRRELTSELAVLMGGRTAEEIVFQEATTGASNDIEKATQIARAMVTEYGMSEIIGPRRLSDGGGDRFLGGDGGTAAMSDEMAAKVDAEVRNILEEAHDEARRILTSNREILDRLANTLIERETLDTEEFEATVGGVPSSEDLHVPTGSAVS